MQYRMENAIDITTQIALFSVGEKGKGLIIVSDRQFRLVLISGRAMKFSNGVQLQAGLNMYIWSSILCAHQVRRIQKMTE